VSRKFFSQILLCYSILSNDCFFSRNSFLPSFNFPLDSCDFSIFLVTDEVLFILTYEIKARSAIHEPRIDHDRDPARGGPAKGGEGSGEGGEETQTDKNEKEIDSHGGSHGSARVSRATGEGLICGRPPPGPLGPAAAVVSDIKNPLVDSRALLAIG